MTSLLPEEGKKREVLGSALFLGTDGRTHGNATKLHQGRVRLGTEKHFFARRVVNQWNRLPADVADALCLQLFKRHLDNTLNNMLELLVSTEVVRQLDFQRALSPFQLNYSILYGVQAWWSQVALECTLTSKLVELSVVFKILGIFLHLGKTVHSHTGNLLEGSPWRNLIYLFFFFLEPSSYSLLLPGETEELSAMLY